MDDAPDFQDIQDWINADPLTLEDLDDQTILILFWRYASVTCQDAVEMVTRLREAYDGDAFTVIGVHSPAFDFEQEPAHVRNAVDRLDVPFPVALDNANTTWRLYGGRYWPRYALIDQDGRIREEHIGDGGYGRLEERIRRLIRWSGDDPGDPLFADEPADTGTEEEPFVTPDIYAGDRWGADLGNTEFHPCASYARIMYHDEQPDAHELNRLYLHGEWIREEDHLHFTGENADDTAYAALRYAGRECHAVMAADRETTLEVTLDGDPVPPEHRGSGLDTDDGRTVVTVDRPDTFQLIDSAEHGIGDIRLHPDDPFRLYAFSFR
jgi:hypothetical protein